ncbi:hypothetical protein M1L60_26345 [Actinoplanes sp. TRM 88003]|uniref:Uncharacterized protein n=1 Tax=Paractinoplanes aksuensis TaxID=2939490 RepID=A0ABT1DTF2_9ACTN|nr:hypothetical protein [Actinoplanes aksuensis]MCO8274126.1 hypothetical protein [Actinoplanes aksuensis]
MTESASQALDAYLATGAARADHSVGVVPHGVALCGVSVLTGSFALSALLQAGAQAGPHPIPASKSDEIRDRTDGVRRGFGSVRVKASIGVAESVGRGEPGAVRGGDGCAGFSGGSGLTLPQGQGPTIGA